MKTKKNLHVTICAIASALILAAVVIWSCVCKHEISVVTVVKEPTCTAVGEEDFVCVDCGKVIQSRTIDKLPHTYGEFELVTRPREGRKGVEIRTCTVCLGVDARQCVCSHQITKTEIEKHPSCTEEGIKAVVCKACDATIEKKSMKMLDCVYGAWMYSKYATPFEDGECYKECVNCGRQVTKTYTLDVPGENYIYIPGTEINATVVPASFTQHSVNRYDTIYSESSPYFKDINAENPFVLGHYYGTCGKIYQAEIGQKIYLAVNGKIETYEVVVSEYSVQNPSMTNIIGQTTGHSMWDNLGGKTLHMYTCYYGKDKAEWKPAHGRHGRWLVLATLVDTVNV